VILDDEVFPAYLIHWNAPDWCASSARSILDSQGLRVDLTVVDNGQNDGPPLEEVLPTGVRVLRAGRNFGYSGGANLALDDWRRRQPRSELCLIGSHDLHVRRDALVELVQMAVKETAYGVLGPALLSPVQSSGGHWNGRRAVQRPLDSHRGLLDRDWVTGNCMLLRRECVNSVRGFDEAFGSYVEDVDFGLRAKDAGWKVGVVTDAIAWGLGSASVAAGPMMVVNGVRLIARRRGPAAATLRGVRDLAFLGFQALSAVGGTLAIWGGEARRAGWRASLALRTRTMKQVLAVVGRAWVGNKVKRHATPKTYWEVRRSAKVMKNWIVDGPTAGDELIRRAGPLASIVITTRDRPQSATRAIESALRQTAGDIEVLVVDDGAVEPFRLLQEDERVRVIRLDYPSGVCAARNRGLLAARGQWITFLDEDGELVPHMLETSLLASAESTLPPPVAALSGVEVVDTTGRIVDIRVPVTRPRAKPFVPEYGGSQLRPTSTLVAPVDVLRAIGGWDEDIMPWVHSDLFLRLSSVCSIQGVQELTCRIRAHSDQPAAEEYLAYAEGISLTLAKHRDAFAANRRARARFLADMGKSYLRAGRWLPAVAATTRALFEDPRRPYALRRWLASLVGPRASSWYFRARGIARAGRS
jgi:GT2 family glycosyltransferase